jgi:hypothetical protein
MTQRPLKRIGVATALLVLGAIGGLWLSGVFSPAQQDAALPVPPEPPRLSQASEYARCLDLLLADPVGARGFARDWHMQGGGEGAAQCEALAQLSLGEADTAAAALERIAARSEAGLAARAAVFGQAAEAWSAESGPVGAISRDPADVVAQMIGAHHQYPDGAVLYLGTSFSPAKDRGAPGMGFTHHEGDVMRIASHRRLTSPRI